MTSVVIFQGVDSILREFDELKRQFVDDPEYATAVVPADDLATSQEQLTAIKVTSLLTAVSTTFAKDFTKEQMTTVLSTACDVLNAVGNTLERSGIPELCAKLRTAAMKCANMLPDKYVAVPAPCFACRLCQSSFRCFCGWHRPISFREPRDLAAPECSELSAGIMTLFNELAPTPEEEV